MVKAIRNNIMNVKLLYFFPHFLHLFPKLRRFNKTEHKRNNFKGNIVFIIFQY